jgi:GTPase Era involved in 16S rRNA processing
LEIFFELKIYLIFLVKVKKDWIKYEIDFKNFGY